MRIKYNPILWNPHARVDAQPDTDVSVTDNNSVTIDGIPYQFDPEDVAWPDVARDTGGVIQAAIRNQDGVLELTVRRFYTSQCPWDTGDYHEVMP